MRRLFWVSLLLALFGTEVVAQNNRLNHSNTIGWYNYFGTFKLADKWSIHSEYQWRREQLITNWQQSLARVGVNYKPSSGVLFRVGYAWIETFPYGEFPLNGLGRDFTEHRIFQMAQLSHKQANIQLSHRFMLEQRFVGRYSSPDVTKEDEYPLLHRMRYMFRADIPLNKQATKSPYLAVYDEVMIGFGTNVNANVFDQNRIGVLIGKPLTKTVRLEGGYLNQTLQFGRLINGQNVFQYNNGPIVNMYLQVN
jgi:hypothetical protein